MRKKYNIQVRNGDGTVIETIKRVIQTEVIGNFCPRFCNYRGLYRLIESDELHLDDPFRAVESEHVDKMFIRPRGKDGVVVATWKDAKQKKTA